MTRDDIIRMAREAGFNVEQGFLLRVIGIDEDLERFAALVAAAEREACARVCEELLSMVSSSDEHMDGVTDCIAAIRARGDKPCK